MGKGCAARSADTPELPVSGVPGDPSFHQRNERFCFICDDTVILVCKIR